VIDEHAVSFSQVSGNSRGRGCCRGGWRRPRDKAKVEAAVLIVERWILARLRNQRFFSLTELNAAIRVLVDELNARLMRKLGASRREFFESIDRPALLPLPAEPYQYAEWRRARVAPDYHIEVCRHFYSVHHGADHRMPVRSCKAFGTPRLPRRLGPAKGRQARLHERRSGIPMKGWPGMPSSIWQAPGWH
jgi:hypothetical protein